MRLTVIVALLCLILQACGSKGALVMPPKPGAEQPQSNSSSNKQN
jgi:predicted small lipoprotein YifL